MRASVVTESRSEGVGSYSRRRLDRPTRCRGAPAAANNQTTGYPLRPSISQMSVSIDSLGITQLSVADRLELIEQIWDSLPVEVQAADVPESHIAELAKRSASAQAQPGHGKSRRKVLDSIQGS